MKNIKELQTKLNKVLNLNLLVDGHYGSLTKNAVKTFQQKYKLYVDGIAGNNTLNRLNIEYNKILKASLLTLNKNRFVIFVDAGHGGIDKNGNYVTSGKRSYHENLALHDNSNYYEGFENRVVAESFIEECTKKGVMCIRLYHPYKDTPLSKRTELVRSWLDQGYYGYLHSFHSNAISSNNSKWKLENTRGFMVFSTIGNNLSDKIATQHYNNVKKVIGSDAWMYRKQDYKDGDVDFEVNFQILRETNLYEYTRFGAILEEWGFHTSSKDCQFILNTRKERVEAALMTASWVKNKLLIK